jgi:tetratricopeptide (TPR) repeat protein
MVLGDLPQARERLLSIERSSPGSSAAAEAQAVRVVMDDPQLEAQLQNVMRAAQTGPVATLADVAARARRLATLHALWPAWMAAAVAERRRGQLAGARTSLEAALELSPGAAAAHADLAEVLIEEEQHEKAREHARRAIELEGETPRTTQLLARAQDSAGRAAPVPTSTKRPSAPPETPGWSDRLNAAWQAWIRK